MRVLSLKKAPITKLNLMLLTSLLHGAPQLKHEARNTLKGINPLWDFLLLSLFFEKMAKNCFDQTVPLSSCMVDYGYSMVDILTSNLSMS